MKNMIEQRITQCSDPLIQTCTAYQPLFHRPKLMPEPAEIAKRLDRYLFEIHDPVNVSRWAS